jgi:hypothetical protein
LFAHKLLGNVARQYGCQAVFEACETVLYFPAEMVTTASEVGKICEYLEKR